jgi:large subunit ribosomal protein L6
MSKVGKKPIQILTGVTVEIQPNLVTVSGPRGRLVQRIRPEIGIEKAGEALIIKARTKSKLAKSLHGLVRTLISNMIKGVTQGFEKTLVLHGVGYRVSLEGEGLKIALGFSHPVMVEPIEGIKYEVEGNNVIKISGADKQLVGQVAAKIREIKKPEPYKGKGIRYQGEEIRLKPGKAAKTGAAEG